MERRIVRLQIKPVAALFFTDKLSSQCEILNVSKKGIFVRSFDIPPVGSTVRVSFKDLQRNGVEVMGIVRWTTDQLRPGQYRSPGFGMRFTEWNQAYHEFLERLLFCEPD